MGSYVLFICAQNAVRKSLKQNGSHGNGGEDGGGKLKIDKRRVENKSSSIANWNGSTSEGRNKKQCQNVSPTYLSPVLMANSVSIFPL